MKIRNKKQIGKILIDKGKITPEQLQEALLQQQGTDTKIGQILIKKNAVSETDLLDALSFQYGIEYKSHLEFSDNNDLFKKIPAAFLKNNLMVPFKVVKSRISIATSDIFKIQPIDDLKQMFPGYTTEIFLSGENEILRIITSHFEGASAATTSELIEDLEESDFEILSRTSTETAEILDTVNDAPIIRLVNTIIRQAVNDKASDIHFEIYEKELVVRFRIDGILYKMFTPPKKFQDSIISRVKIMANLNIAENRLPQDGRIQVKVSGKEIDIRVSVFPTQFGERIVLRLLNKSDMSFDLNTIGFSDEALKKFNSLIDITHGIILVTGPTGSGKSTTLYGVLSRLNTDNVNILTVEDPIEYQIQGIGQMQIKPKIGLTFSTGLRSILRQDPDIVMIGEIRDTETAEIAVQAALTGHRVFSTLHTNDAASGVTRLVDMGVEPYLISSSVNAFLAQRLVRKICPHCITSYKPAQQELTRGGLTKAKLKKDSLYKGKGCEKCLNTGYSGRLGIFELMPVTDGIRKLIMSGADASTIKDLAIKEGMKTLLQDGIEKVVRGLTTLEEVLRVS
ncbi:MAG TPA: type II secretion system ATPase GspE [Spirochaetota bacterium]|nr:type II secretion system ATPase GspE [Spirochaetota bacterium]HPJ40794.1 type II secretion system ATPase GspE [Spirochaetota bacterium]HPR36063.1 type II secretion system ATPase GspE [Spirochaetota bacterium]HRX45977.1 type II secretion system ATPase GspE [Spirochaetota bacterium]